MEWRVDPGGDVLDRRRVEVDAGVEERSLGVAQQLPCAVAFSSDTNRQRELSPCAHVTKEIIVSIGKTESETGSAADCEEKSDQRGCEPDRQQGAAPEQDRTGSLQKGSPS